MSDYIGEGVIGVVIVGLLVLIIWGGIQDAKNWNQYQVAHHCVISGKKAGQAGVGINVSGGGGVVSTYTPSQDIYRCDGDEIIIR